MTPRFVDVPSSLGRSNTKTVEPTLTPSVRPETEYINVRRADQASQQAQAKERRSKAQRKVSDSKKQCPACSYIQLPMYSGKRASEASCTHRRPASNGQNQSEEITAAQILQAPPVNHQTDASEGGSFDGHHRLVEGRLREALTKAGVRWATEQD